MKKLFFISGLNFRQLAPRRKLSLNLKCIRLKKSIRLSFVAHYLLFEAYPALLGMFLHPPKKSCFHSLCRLARRNILRQQPNSIYGNIFTVATLLKKLSIEACGTLPTF